MFYVKATYRNQTRKFSFPDSAFPSYDQLYNQLYRVFPISHSYYLSKLLFSPFPESRILIGMECHSSDEYDNYVRPFKGKSWPGALLRFAVYDETPHKLPSNGNGVAESTSSQSRMSLDWDLGGNGGSAYGSTIDVSVTGSTASTLVPLPRLPTPPPPIIYCITPPQIPSPMEIDHASPTTAIPSITCVPVALPTGNNDHSMFTNLQSGYDGLSGETYQSRHSPQLLGGRDRPSCGLSWTRMVTPPQQSQAQSQQGVDASRAAQSSTAASAPPLMPQEAPIPPLPFVPSFIPPPPSSSQSSTQPPQVAQSSTSTACCPISRGRQDMQSVLNEFFRDFDRVMSETFGPDYAHGRTASTPTPPQPSAAASNGGTSGTAEGSHAASTQAHEPRIPGSFVVPSSPVVEGNGQPTQQDTTEPELVIHNGVVCDACNEIIIGVRHKCLDCRDYDLCTQCISSGRAEAHNPFHEFFDIEKPGRVVVHNVYSGDGERDGRWGGRGQRGGHRGWHGRGGHGRGGHGHGSRGGWGRRYTSPPPPPTQDDVQASTPDPEPEPNPFANWTVVHDARCDLCDSGIKGDRYKCLNCPDYDVCSQCFTITPEQHPHHGFVKVSKPKVLIFQDTLRPETHHARCDSCGRDIYRVRYKCMHPDCPDYDLCQNCEALPIPVHPANHPLLKMKTADTVIPTVYRVGQRQLIPERPISPPIATVQYSSVPAPFSPEWQPDVVEGVVCHIPSPPEPVTATPFSVGDYYGNGDSERMSTPRSFRSPSPPPRPSTNSIFASPPYMESPVVELPERLPSPPPMIALPRTPRRSYSPETPPQHHVPSPILTPSPMLPSPPSLPPRLSTPPSLMVPEFASWVPLQPSTVYYHPSVASPSPPPSHPPPAPIVIPDDLLPETSDSRPRSPGVLGFEEFGRHHWTRPYDSPVSSPSPRMAGDYMLFRNDEGMLGPVCPTYHPPMTGYDFAPTPSVWPPSPPPPPPPAPPAPRADATFMSSLALAREAAVGVARAVNDRNSNSNAGDSRRSTTPSVSVTIEDTNGSVTSSAPPRLPSELGNDLYHELWPAVANELKHLLLPQTQATPQVQVQGPPHIDTAVGTAQTVEGTPLTEMPSAVTAQTSQSKASSIIGSDVHIGSNVTIDSPPLGTEPLLTRSVDPQATVDMLARLANTLSALLSASTPQTEVTTVNGNINGGSTLRNTNANSTRPTSIFSNLSQPRSDVALRATFLSDNNIPDGQIFPPGAEFVKSWRMVNDGEREWPETTEMVFVAGHKLGTDAAGVEKFRVGHVAAGEEINVYTSDLKAPEYPGKYVSYWRLSDGQGTQFGQSVWVDITVAEPISHTDSSNSDDSLASSSVIMPHAAASRASVPSEQITGLQAPSGPASSFTIPSTTAEEDEEAPSEHGSDAESSVSLISAPSSEGSSVWEDTRSQGSPEQARDMEYVVLYETSSEEE
ncbi:hypothetical protein JAAARDRAFT_29129 [Jaapia argillacea MUCL 33604]|uniref:ZZ-type domain-containing protein n=1 Tax=Jaapia argillacea MUCL 33604 TaxID=933084 RepID=A0A067QHY3_9AGAM|nr:hypothetical protein JAAARDRAFT_29129 [Jaapia argillacea MUCL 33604]